MPKMNRREAYFGITNLHFIQMRGLTFFSILCLVPFGHFLFL
jgi:hypothetical protein